MKPRKLSLTEQVETLELANRTLRTYAQTLEEKVARYEKVLQICPKFRMEQSAAGYSVCHGNRIAVSNAPIRQLPAGATVRISHPQPPVAPSSVFPSPVNFAEDDFEEDDWDGLEESDFADDWDDFDDDFEEDEY